MKQHRYKITVEHLADAQGAPSTHEPLQFEARNHDDIIAVWSRGCATGAIWARTPPPRSASA